ncbi:MAG: hypothetical protein ABII88_03120 [Candidatus Omnitrophota bacterium]
MKGFTIAELMVSLCIMMFLFIGLYATFDIGSTINESCSGWFDVQHTLRRAVGGMEKELRQSSSGNVNITNGGAKISFRVPQNINPVTYSNTISYYLNGNQLIREHPPGTQQVLSGNFDAISFVIAGNSVSVSLQIRKQLKHDDIVVAWSKNVSLRN